LQLKSILQQVPDPRGKQGQDYKLWSILSLIILSLLCGRRGMMAACVLGRSLSRRQKAALEACPVVPGSSIFSGYAISAA
jgi:hypothetical protein